ncbi:MULTISPECIES: FeoA family protein [Pseudanabaena]|uniref:FeoA family protein n=1 Tax=Pseudanabaena TaxID=1152 RepID=UPI0024785E7F|nr:MULTISPECIES: FeoA family protein [Pseudanabaena]MEA5486703.1 FeoA family protein [Pseudanabaena sp. CCNP1317]WGS73526.1 FeoA family protein [Pseudanabaena galeata CCNP1313]
MNNKITSVDHNSGNYGLATIDNLLERSPKAKTLALSEIKVGDRVRIVSLNCDESNGRLMGMGFMPGVVLEVVSSAATGSVIVALQDHRLGLGMDMAQCIQVVSEDSDANQHIFNVKKTMPNNSKTPTTKLQDVAIGSHLKVVGYEPTARDYKRKLLAMGLTPATELVVKRHAPLGDPTEIEVRGFRLSLRKAEADALLVELIQGA